MPTIRAAAVQFSPVLYSREATVAKLCDTLASTAGIGESSRDRERRACQVVRNPLSYCLSN